MYNSLVLGLKEEGRGPRIPGVSRRKKKAKIHGMFNMCQPLN